MYGRQITAYKKPCYIDADLADPIFEQTQTLGRLTLRTYLRILAFFQNELWRANIFVADENGNSLKESDLTEEEKTDVTQILYSLLEGVGRDKIYDLKDECDFDSMRLLSPLELKKLPAPNLKKLFKITERQQFALKHPFPTIEDMLAQKFTLIQDFGGGIMRTVLTVEDKGDRLQWHASISTPDAKNRPQNIFGGIPAAQTEMAIDLLKLMLTGVGSGAIEIIKPDNDSVTMHMFRALAAQEKKSLSIQPTSPFASQKQSPFFAKRFFN